MFILASVFGFYCLVDTGVEAGERELSETETELDGRIYDRRRLCTDFSLYAPRKVDKTGMSAYVQLVFFLMEDYNSQIYCCANSADQSKTLYTRTRSMLEYLNRPHRFHITATVCDWEPKFKDLRDSMIVPLSAGGKTKDGLVGWELKGKTVGIIGLGKIGSRTAELFHAFGCRILAQSRTVHKEVPAYVEQVTQEELLAASDIVVLHCPLNDSTRGMINAEKLAMMKSSAMLINVARGPVVVEKDLAEALEKGVIACAGIDVFDKEPPLDPASPLLAAPHTLVTPHVAFATKESMSLRAKIVFENLENWMEGRQSNIVL